MQCQEPTSGFGQKEKVPGEVARGCRQGEAQEKLQPVQENAPPVLMGLARMQHLEGHPVFRAQRSVVE